MRATINKSLFDKSFIVLTCVPASLMYGILLKFVDTHDTVSFPRFHLHSHASGHAVLLFSTWMLLLFMAFSFLLFRLFCEMLFSSKIDIVLFVLVFDGSNLGSCHSVLLPFLPSNFNLFLLKRGDAT